MSKNKLLILMLVVMAILFVGSCGGTSPNNDPNNTGTNTGGPTDNNKPNNYAEYTPVIRPESGINWPLDQALPTFTSMTDELKVLDMNASQSAYSIDECIKFSVFAGIVNKTKVEVLIYADSRTNQWNKALGFNVGTRYNNANTKYTEFAAHYKDRIKGFVVYNTSGGGDRQHMRNVANTIANMNDGYLPVTEAVKTRFEEEAGISVPSENIIDVTDWTERTRLEIYQRLYDEYWSDSKCSKRILLHRRPSDVNNRNLQPQNRDLAAAVGAAVISLDTRESQTAERALYEKYIKDMADAPGTSIVLGWFITERSGISAGSIYGVATIPADHFNSYTTYAGTDHKINIPTVPKRPALENKVYLAMYITDGDNFQYVQGGMKSNWDSNSRHRGKVAVNWTVAPGLVDAGPGILNYFYDSATDFEYLVAGPSGMGYLMPKNTLHEEDRDGITTSAKNFLYDKTYMDNYTKLTETYMQRSGLRVLTIWDDANDDMRKSFAQNTRTLYGATIQEAGGPVNNSVEGGYLPFLKHTSWYFSEREAFQGLITPRVSGASTRQPSFFSYHLNGWGGYWTQEVVALDERLKTSYADRYEFVRADHFFSYYNEHNKLPFNLSMLEATKVIASNDTDIDNLTDGTPNTLWSDSNSEAKYIQFEFDRTYAISRYVLRLAEANELPKDQNAKEWKVEVSSDGSAWTQVDHYTNNTSPVVDIDLADDAQEASYLRIVFNNTGSDDTLRIADVEIYGAVT